MNGEAIEECEPQANPDGYHHFGAVNCRFKLQ